MEKVWKLAQLHKDELIGVRSWLLRKYIKMFIGEAQKSEKQRL